ncbi:PTS system fructose-like EIIB component 2 [Thalassobacillus devorans]|uniref:PTS system fructose-like EIIB component 2 n=1 Tax=Thalassobacillus devorans TaxID=279813 RepID=A0ABQ1P658_9BACI|nr:fructose PTS transporter subunit IIB [Thalassobacillus devorans]NIK28005.1 fructose-specific phosphotransferase system IIB component [Thalassobacillus devorans]GGC89673.1 PTS system fructose-like EIIB component 2 [Thalassobacillus devorans]
MKLIAITACPAGVAHTHMAAAALESAAKKNGVKIKVEKQGAMGIENQIKEKEIADAEALILAVDTAIAKPERFEGIPTVKVSVGEAVKNSQGLISKAIELTK